MKPPPAPKDPRKVRDLTDTESWYLACFRILSAHYKRPPSTMELTIYCGKKSTWSPRVVLMRLESFGILRRDRNGKFHEVAQ